MHHILSCFAVFKLNRTNYKAFKIIIYLYYKQNGTQYIDSILSSPKNKLINKLSCCKTTDLCHHFSLFSESREGPNVRDVKCPVPLSDYLHLSFLFIVSSLLSSWNHDQVVVSRVLRLHHHPLFSGHDSGHDARLTVRRPLLGWRRVSILIRRNSKTVAHPHLLIGDGDHDLSLASPISFPGKQELVVIFFVFFDHEAFLSAGGHAVGRGGVNSTLSHCSGGHHRAAEVCVSRTEVIGAARGTGSRWRTVGWEVEGSKVHLLRPLGRPCWRRRSALRSPCLRFPELHWNLPCPLWEAQCICPQCATSEAHCQRWGS